MQISLMPKLNGWAMLRTASLLFLLLIVAFGAFKLSHTRFDSMAEAGGQLAAGRTFEKLLYLPLATNPEQIRLHSTYMRSLALQLHIEELCYRYLVDNSRAP